MRSDVLNGIAVSVLLTVDCDSCVAGCFSVSSGLFGCFSVGNSSVLSGCFSVCGKSELSGCFSVVVVVDSIA